MLLGLAPLPRTAPRRVALLPQNYSSVQALTQTPHRHPRHTPRPSSRPRVRGRDLWKWLIGAVLAFLLCEMLLLASPHMKSTGDPQPSA